MLCPRRENTTRPPSDVSSESRAPFTRSAVLNDTVRDRQLFRRGVVVVVRARGDDV